MTPNPLIRRRMVALVAAVLLGWLAGTVSSVEASDLPAVNASKPCADLLSIDLSDIAGTGSRVESTKQFDAKGKTFCLVEGILAPSIGFRVELPEIGWTQRYLQVGCGGLCGAFWQRFDAADGCVPVTEGRLVIATTDMGHQGNDPSFGRDPQKRADFAYRGVHLTSRTAKKLIAAFYGQPEKHSYFIGCSDGGREAMMEALRYPDDFDGIVAGAPVLLFQFQNSLHHAWLALTNTGVDGKPIFTKPRLPILHQAVVAACDELDGLADGLISDPRLCRFDPRTIQCTTDVEDSSTCLTADEVVAAKKFYEGPMDPETDEHLTVGEEQYGSELAWAGVFVPEAIDRPTYSGMAALNALNNLIFEKDPPSGYTLTDLKFDKATIELLRARHPLFDPSSPDLRPFAASGGKLILWHGWADPNISPLITIAFHEALEREMGPTAVASFERLYFLPGVYHCGRGEGMPTVDFLTPLMNWVENGAAPGAVITRGVTDGDKQVGLPATPAKLSVGTSLGEPSVERSRPVYPYPGLATYAGGDPNTAASFIKGEPLYTAPARSWAGANFFRPYKPME